MFHIFVFDRHVIKRASLVREWAVPSMFRQIHNQDKKTSLVRHEIDIQLVILISAYVSFLQTFYMHTNFMCFILHYTIQH